MPSRPKAIKTHTAIPKKRPLSKNASSSVAKRPSTQGGFVISSDGDDDEDDESADDENECFLVSSKTVDQQAVVSSKTASPRAVVFSKAPASIREPLPAEPTKASLPTKQLNKARISALLGKNRQLKQTTRKALPSSMTTQSPQRVVDTAATNELAESSNKKASLPRMLGSSLLGVKQAVASRPQQPLGAISAVKTQDSFFQEKKSTYTLGHTALIKAIDDTKGEEATLAAQPHIGIDKEKGQRAFFPVLKPVVKQVPTKCQSGSKRATPLQLAVSSGANLGSKTPRLSKPEPTILQSQSQHKRNEPKTEQQVPEVHSGDMESTKPNSCSSEQSSQEDAPSADNDGAGDPTLQKPIPYLPNTFIRPRIKRENRKSNERIGNGSDKASEVVAAKLSPPVVSDVTPDEVTNASSEALVLPRCELSKDAQPYFEYSIFRKDWSSEQDENEVSNEEIIPLRFTNVLEANMQTERLFQSEKYHSYMIVDSSTKRDEHGCIILTRSIAPFDHPTHKHHTKIYVQRDYVSKFANQTPQSLKGTTFISDTVYILRLFKLIEAPDAVNSDSLDSDSNSPVAAASDHIRVCHPHDRPDVYTTLEAANRAAKSLQVQLSHKRNPKDAMTEAFQKQDLKKLDKKVRELESAGKNEERFWRSKFNASGLGGDKLELVVEKVGICGPRNI